MKRLVVFTGAGISADSGIATFRDSNGLWANYRIEDVCTPEALVRNRKLVIDFYNERRKEVLSKKPNAGHLALKELENHFDVRVITQNIDDLHERAGSSHVLHLHGEITKLRSSNDDLATVPLEGWEQPLDMRHPDGSLLRPYVVFLAKLCPILKKLLKLRKQPIFSWLSALRWQSIRQHRSFITSVRMYRFIWLTRDNPHLRTLETRLLISRKSRQQDCQSWLTS